MLIGKGASVNLQEEDGFAPLHVSCQNGHTMVVETLLNAKAEPNLIARSTSWQPIHYAAQVQVIVNIIKCSILHVFSGTRWWDSKLWHSKEAWWCNFGHHFGNQFWGHFVNHLSGTSDIISDINSEMISEIMSEVAPLSFRSIAAHTVKHLIFANT